MNLNLLVYFDLTKEEHLLGSYAIKLRYMFNAVHV